MVKINEIEITKEIRSSFYDRPNVKKLMIPVAEGIQMGFEKVFNSKLGFGGVYGTWGKSYDNESLTRLIEERLNEPMRDDEKMNLADLGFISRHHIPDLTQSEHLELELEVGTRLLAEAMQVNGWKPEEIGGVLLGISGPVTDNYVYQICKRAGIPDSALKVSVHKACDGSMGALNLSLNPDLAVPGQVNIAEELYGKKVLVGGIEGLSRFLSKTRDKNALQLFANGAGVMGVIPGESFKFLAGKEFEAYDEEGVLAVRMFYPHSKERIPGRSMVEVSKDTTSGMRVAGLMHEPDDDDPIAMAGLMGMVKLFVRTGVQVVSEVYQSYQALMQKLGTPNKSISVAIAHHANYKINSLKDKQLKKIGVNFPIPWLLNDFGNVCAASNIIAFMRQLPLVKPGDHVLFDGFGAGTYYDVMAVAMGG
jgi:3-oxoacyl-[acyl-carrier-protein] synthase III